MGMILGVTIVFTVLVLAFTTDPEIKRCEYCEGPITLRELWTHFKKCPLCPKPKGRKEA